MFDLGAAATQTVVLVMPTVCAVFTFCAFHFWLHSSLDLLERLCYHLWVADRGFILCRDFENSPHLLVKTARRVFLYFDM